MFLNEGRKCQIGQKGGIVLGVDVVAGQSWVRLARFGGTVRVQIPYDALMTFVTLLSFAALLKVPSLTPHYPQHDPGSAAPLPLPHHHYHLAHSLVALFITPHFCFLL